MSPVPTLAHVSLVLSTSALLLGVLLQQHLKRLTKDVDDAVSILSVCICTYSDSHLVFFLVRSEGKYDALGNCFHLASRRIYLGSRSLHHPGILHLVLCCSFRSRHIFRHCSTCYRFGHLEDPQSIAQYCVYPHHRADTHLVTFSSRGEGQGRRIQHLTISGDDCITLIALRIFALIGHPSRVSVSPL